MGRLCDLAQAESELDSVFSSAYGPARRPSEVCRSGKITPTRQITAGGKSRMACFLLLHGVWHFSIERGSSVSGAR
jgi:hypothetical protein